MIRILKMKVYCLITFLISNYSLFPQQTTDALIPILVGNKYGFSTENGKMVLPAKFENAFPFYPGYILALVVDDNKPFLINRKGKKVFEGAMDYLKNADFSNLKAPKPELIDIKNSCISDTCNKFRLFVKINPLNLFDKVGEMYLVSDLKKVFLIDEKGKQKSEKYDRIRHFIYGDFEYCITEDSTTNKKGLLDKSGKVLLQCTYDQINYKSEGVFAITDNNLSHDYKVFVEPRKYEEVQELISETRLQIKRRNSKTGVVDSSGKIIIPFTYDRLYPLSDNKFIFLKENSTGIINENEEQLFVESNHNSQGLVPYFPFTDSLIFFLSNNKWILVDINGKKYIQQFDSYYVDYQKVIPGIAAVCQNGKVGVINKNVEFIVPAIYDEVVCCSENQSFIVRKDKMWSWLNASGKVICESFDEFSFLIKNLLYISKNGKNYFVDMKGFEFVKK